MCSRLTGDGGLQYLKGEKEVYSITLSSCWNIRNEALQYLRGIHKIKLCDNSNITDEGLKYLSKELSGMTERKIYKITIKKYNKITIEGLRYLEGIPVIKIINCKKIKKKNLSQLNFPVHFKNYIFIF